MNGELSNGNKSMCVNNLVNVGVNGVKLEWFRNDSGGKTRVC